MKNQKQTIRKIVSFLNNPEEDAGFWLPNIQRSFVWSEEQICRLFDSIMRGYPIGTLLVWKTTSSIRRRKFIDTWRVENPRTGRRDLLKYREADRNQLAKCMLLSREENGAGGKRDTPADEWFKGKPEAYLDMHLIPRDPALWELGRFEDFIAARRELIRQKFASLLVQAQKVSA